MSIVIQPEPKTSTFPNKWNIWRLINSAVIFFSFFAPWIWYVDTGDYGKETGFQFLYFIQYMAKFEIFVQEREFSERVRLALGMGQLTVDLYAILIYCALNLLLLIIGSKLTKRSFWITSLFCIFLIAIGTRSLWKIPFSFIGDGWHGFLFMQWGYWLALSGLISSLVFEIDYFITKRT